MCMREREMGLHPKNKAHTSYTHLANKGAVQADARPGLLLGDAVVGNLTLQVAVGQPMRQ